MRNLSSTACGSLASKLSFLLTRSHEAASCAALIGRRDTFFRKVAATDCRERREQARGSIHSTAQFNFLGLFLRFPSSRLSRVSHTHPPACASTLDSQYVLLRRAGNQRPFDQSLIGELLLRRSSRPNKRSFSAIACPSFANSLILASSC